MDSMIAQEVEDVGIQTTACVMKRTRVWGESEESMIKIFDASAQVGRILYLLAFVCSKAIQCQHIR